MLFASGERPAPFEVELPAAAVSEIAVCVEAEAFRRSIGRYVRVLFGAQESLVRARATTEVAEEAGGVLALEATHAGSSDVVVPCSGVEEPRSGKNIDGPRRGRPIRVDELLLRFRVQDFSLNTEMIEK
jgi:hypothetical protein